MNNNTHSSDVIVIGGGLVGSSVAYGLLRQGLSVTVIDGADDTIRPSRGNFGLVWVQGKGYGMADYARWSFGSARQWPALRDELQAQTGIDVELMQPGGLHICLSEEEMAQRLAKLQWLESEVGDPAYRTTVLSRDEAARQLPGLGPEVVGATYSTMDGHCNPLKLLRALYSANIAKGARIHNRMQVDAIRKEGGIFHVSAGERAWQAPRIVIAAGHATQQLSAMVGMFVPVRPNKGQVFITERVQPFLPHPTNYVRQTDEGTVQIGDSMEELGFDDMVRVPVSAKIAARAVKCFPVLANARVVRTWAALRVMSPDGFPMYQESASHPGAFAVTCHSGVTLAAQHVFCIAPWVATGLRPAAIEAFPATRFTPETEVKPYGI
ncbi:NAD(P)/FAD-dependent oxidoreductase [Comamonas sp. MYb396]|uniref:NAD(P)/FAD-dependent oxidoreductase n=1 Tax=Comamonas sp. MYb396 TaxID=2745302 RepID=UPI00309ACEAD